MPHCPKSLVVETLAEPDSAREFHQVLLSPDADELVERRVDQLPFRSRPREAESFLDQFVIQNDVRAHAESS
jgi:hypothetical protein